MRTSFAKDIARSIKGSLGRFLAIMGIVALGCGFYAGLQMCGPDMRADADAYYDGTRLWDLRLISSLGFSDDDVDRVRGIEGVEQVMPSLTCDAMARLGTTQVVVRISTLDVVSARQSAYEAPYVVTSSNDAYLNRPVLRQGRWPEAAGECVICDDITREGSGLGQTVELLTTDASLDELLGVRKLTIVGTVSSSNYPNSSGLGSTNLGTGKVDQFLYVAPASLAEDAPYTEMYLTVRGAADELSESDAYVAVVSATKGRLTGLQRELSAARQADLKAKAQAQLDEKWAEYDDEKAKAEQELADARAELDDAAAQIAQGEQELADGEAAFDEGRAELERQRASAYAQLDEAASEIERNQVTLNQKAQELEKGIAELDAAERTLDESEEQLAAGERELAASEAQLADGQAQLDQAQQQLDDARADAQAKIAEGRAAWEEQRAPLAQASSDLGTCIEALHEISALVGATGEPTPEELEQLTETLESAVAAARSLYVSGLIDFQSEEVSSQVQALLDEVRQEFEGIRIDEGTDVSSLVAKVRAATAGSLDHVRAATESARRQVDDGIALGDQTLADEVAAAEAQLAEAQATIDAKRAELAEGAAQVVEARAQLEDGKAQIAAGRKGVAEGRQKIQDGKAQLLDGQRQLDAARLQLADGREKARRELEAAQAQLDDAASQLEEARARLLDARRQYQDGLRSYEQGKDKADRSFADALAQLQDAQRTINEIDLPDVYLLDRTQSEGAAAYHADSKRIDAIADVFPFMFFLVAALVSLTTMTRMVEDDRVLIGTYKALGYGTPTIAAKYLAYAGAASVTGATLGIIVLAQVLPLIVMNAYSIIYVVPIHPFPLPVRMDSALASGVLGVSVTLVATLGAVVSSLREVPAALMLPRAPKVGKRIMLERVGFVWSRLSFIWKVTCRNLFRYKRRFLMTTIGISGCTALLLVGFGLHDSIWDIIDRQYGPIVRHDTTIGLDETALELDVLRVCTYLDNTGEVSDIVRVQTENMQASSTTSDETIHVSVVVPRNVAEIGEVITFRNRISGHALVFDDNAVIITEKLAMKYGLDVGDDIVLFDQDNVGNAVGGGYRLAITGVAENYVGNLVYLGRKAYDTLDAGVPVFATIYANTTADATVRTDIADSLHDMEAVSTVVFSDETIAIYRTMLSVVDMVVILLIVSAAALAYIVLFNLTNINIGERVREIASLKVLGFTRIEVYTYIFREIVLLALIGDVVGLAFGAVLERFVVVTAEVDYVMFGRSIHPASFCYAFVLTMVFTVMVILSMRHRLDRVDMVESLKSVD